MPICGNKNIEIGTIPTASKVLLRVGMPRGLHHFYENPKCFGWEDWFFLAEINTKIINRV
jgi:hypothetical protein